MPDYPIRYYKKSHHFTEDMRSYRDRESYVLIFEDGAVEGWRAGAATADPTFSPTGYYGGIEIHSRTPSYEGQPATPGNCDLLGGEDCYHDGSSMAFDQIMHDFDHPEYIYAQLRAWTPEQWKNKEKENAQ